MSSKKIKCYKCNGKGYNIEIDYTEAFFTLGLSLLYDLSERQKCDSCNGKGYLFNDDVENKVNKAFDYLRRIESDN